MKRLAAFALILLLLAGHAPAATVYFDLADFQHTYLTARRLVMTPETNPSVSGTNIVSKDPRSQVTSSSGRVTFTNVAAGTYRCEFYGPSVVTPFYITLTNTSATINAKDIISVSTNSPAGSSAYSMASADEMFVAWASTARNYLSVATNGNDATAVRGRVDRPWRTLVAAKTNALSGDTVNVYGGSYTNNDLWKGGVTWWFHSDAKLYYTDPGSGTGRGLFDDRADPGTTCRVLGNGQFTHLQAHFAGNMKGAFVLTNASSVMVLDAERISVGEGGADSVAGIVIENGRLLGRIREMYDISEDPSQGGLRSSGIYFKAGYGQIHVGYMEMAAYSVYAKEAPGSPTGSLYVTGTHWKHRAPVDPENPLAIQSLVWTEANAAATPNTNFLVDIHCPRMEAAGGIYVGQIGVLRITSDDHISQGNVIHENDRAIEVHLKVKKAIGVTSQGAGSLWTMPNFSGRIVAEVGEYRQAGTDAVFKFEGTGSVDLSGHYARSANGAGINLVGAGTWRVKGLRIDTTPSNSASNVPVNLGNSSSGLVLQNCVLLAPALADSVEAAVARTITAYGTVANKAKDANVTVNVQAITVDANVQ